MATPNQFLPGNNRPSLGNQTPNRKVNCHADARSSRRQTDSCGRIPAQIKGASSALDARVSTGTRSLPSVILLSNGSEPAAGLRLALDSSRLQIQSLGSCGEVARELAQHHLPVTIFTDVRLSDGDWKQVLRIAQEAPVPVKVIVVSRIVDGHLYLDALDAGAFDFVVPPFCAADLDYILVNAFHASLNHHPSEPVSNS